VGSDDERVLRSVVVVVTGATDVAGVTPPQLWNPFEPVKETGADGDMVEELPAALNPTVMLAYAASVRCHAGAVITSSDGVEEAATRSPLHGGPESVAALPRFT
jgi:hypothetical protein